MLVSKDVAKKLRRPAVAVLGHGEAPKHGDAGRVDLTYTGVPSQFTAPFPFLTPGVYTVDVTAKEYNGNLGVARQQTVTVKGNG